MSDLLGAWQPIYDEIVYAYYDSIGNYHWFGKYSGEHFEPRVSSTNTNYQRHIFHEQFTFIYNHNGKIAL